MKKIQTLMLSLLFTFTIMTSAVVLALSAVLTNINANFNLSYEPAGAVSELWNSGSKTFNSAPVQRLLNVLAGKSGATINDLTTLSKDTMTASDISSKNGEDLVVTLGGLTWHAVYLSQSKGGDVILTLWLTSNEQEAWQVKGEEADSNKLGALYGLAKGTATNLYGLYSDWAYDWATDDPSYAYPSNMYGTSYIRVVTLNAGGQYALSGGGSLSAVQNQSEDNLFAEFTMSKFGLTAFLVQPKDVAWQEDGQETVSRFGFSYSCPNENYSSNIPDNGTYNGKTYKFSSYKGDYYNYADKTGNANWSEDYLWLPSLSETGYSSTKIGIWETSQNQRKNYDGSSTSFSVSAGIGDTSVNKNYATTAYTYSWLRSGAIVMLSIHTF